MSISYRVAHGEPMSDAGRLWCNWILPFAGLAATVAYISATSGERQMPTCRLQGLAGFCLHHRHLG